MGQALHWQLSVKAIVLPKFMQQAFGTMVTYLEIYISSMEELAW